MDNSATISSQLSIVNCQLGVLKSYFPTLTDAQKQQIDALFDLYSDWNSKINVISRKDIENLSQPELEALSVKLRSIRRKGGLKRPAKPELAPRQEYVIVNMTNNEKAN